MNEEILEGNTSLWMDGAFTVTRSQTGMNTVFGFTRKGLGVHRECGDWRITDLRTGMMIVKVDSCGQAKDLAELLDEAMDDLGAAYAKMSDDIEAFKGAL